MIGKPIDISSETYVEDGICDSFWGGNRCPNRATSILLIESNLGYAIMCEPHSYAILCEPHSYAIMCEPHRIAYEAIYGLHGIAVHNYSVEKAEEFRQNFLAKGEAK